MSELGIVEEHTKACRKHNFRNFGHYGVLGVESVCLLWGGEKTMSETTEERRYREYLERHDGYYPERKRLSLEEHRKLQAEWDTKYEQLWKQVNAWLDRNGYALDFGKTPMWPEIVRLETEMCV